MRRPELNIKRKRGVVEKIDKDILIICIEMQRWKKIFRNKFNVFFTMDLGYNLHFFKRSYINIMKLTCKSIEPS